MHVLYPAKGTRLEADSATPQFSKLSCDPNATLVNLCFLWLHMVSVPHSASLNHEEQIQEQWLFIPAKQAVFSQVLELLVKSYRSVSS